MRISSEGKVGIWLGLIGLLCTGATVVAPWLGWTCVMIAITGGIIMLIQHISDWLGFKGKTDHKRKMIAVVGMILSVLVFIAFANLYFHKTLPGISQLIIDPVPEVGTIQYVGATMKLEHQASTNLFSAQIIVEIKNTSDKLIYFKAETAGNVNGIAFDFSKVNFDGYINPNSSMMLLSNRITDIKIENSKSLSVPTVRGIFEYELDYRFAKGKEFNRRTEKGLEITYWPPIEDKPAGTIVKTPIMVRLYNEKEI